MKNNQTYLTGSNAEYLEMMYEQYRTNPSAVPEEWRRYFQDNGADNEGTTEHEQAKAFFKELAMQPKHARQSETPAPAVAAKTATQTSVPLETKTVADTATTAAPKQAAPSATTQKQAHVEALINAYRQYGHHHAMLDPLQLTEQIELPRLSLAYHGLEHDKDTVFSAGDFTALKGTYKLKDIIKVLEYVYCGYVGFEYMHISNPEEVEWLQNRIESSIYNNTLSPEEKRDCLTKLISAESLEKYLGRKYVGQKRFSLEGGDSLIPYLFQTIYSASEYDAKELILGMAHRGRLNVLINVIGKSPKDLFEEFEGKSVKPNYSGDVKYHMGFSSNLVVNGKNIHLALGYNPSHLEIVGPVVGGSVRARQRRRQDQGRNKVLPFIIHGDAAMAGQGVVMETFAMSQARGFRIGGAIHLVINNQIGFTTSNPYDARSSLYCTDVAKMIQAPILHVNADDPESVIFAAKLAVDYRMKFNKDIVVDLVCYRRHGHNESDEPSGTQPVMYQKIKKHPTTVDIYAQQLLSENVIDQAWLDEAKSTYVKKLESGTPVVDGLVANMEGYEFATNWHRYYNQTWRADVDTSVSLDRLQSFGRALMTLPEGFELQTQVKKIMQNRLQMAQGDLPIDWGFAETLAYASLLDDGFPIRLCGQDSGRGTFAHRHAVLHNQVDASTYCSLEHVSVNQADIIVIDSILSEEGVLAFEYGFSTAEPDNLVIWEAQFGDFVNGAQVVIDQFITSAEQKWGGLSGLVMLLPHGYEGSGPEHSSARLERFLQLSAQENIQVCVPTTPAQIFHLLRRQMIRPYRKPLVIMSPKSLLRHKLVTSSLEQLTNGKFQLVIPEEDNIDPSAVTRLIICSGKVYYDLLAKRREINIGHIAIIRIEQLYPFPEVELREEILKYPNAKDIVWCQEESKNQGAWFSIRHRLTACLEDSQSLTYVGRRATAAPAAGVRAVHLREQKALVDEALEIVK